MSMNNNDAFQIMCHACEQWTNPEFITEIAGDCICEACEEIVAEQMWNDNYDHEDRWDLDDVAADADTLRSAGFGTDEDYGFYGDMI